MSLAASMMNKEQMQDVIDAQQREIERLKVQLGVSTNALDHWFAAAKKNKGQHRRDPRGSGGGHHMTEWQLIETAPKDGTWIIGYRKKRSDEERSQVAAIFYYFDTVTEIIPLGDDIFRRVRGQVGKWFDAQWDEFEPTHWAAIPTPSEEMQ